MKRLILTICIAGVLFWGVVFLKPPLKAEEVDSSQLLQKLDDVLNGQAEILKQLAELKHELNIVKVRVTRFR